MKNELGNKEELSKCDYCNKTIDVCGPLSPAEFEGVGDTRKVKDWICDLCARRFWDEKREFKAL